jgi:hypothetical protein
MYEVLKALGLLFGAYLAAGFTALICFCLFAPKDKRLKYKGKVNRTCAREITDEEVMALGVPYTDMSEEAILHRRVAALKAKRGDTSSKRVTIQESPTTTASSSS